MCQKNIHKFKKLYQIPYLLLKQDAETISNRLIINVLIKRIFSL